MKTHLTADFFAANRNRLAESLKGGVVALSAYAEMQRSGDMAHAFEQEANFWYLTGIERPDWWVIGDSARGKWWLVAPEMSQISAVFDGDLTPREATEISGISEVIDRNEALGLLRQLHRSHSLAYTCDPSPHLEKYYTFVLNPAPKELRELLARNFNRVQNCRQELVKLRAIKQPEELACMKEAIRLTVAGFELVRNKLQDYKYEYEIEADFSYHFRLHGAQGHAYTPIVAGGKHACTLHYYQNDDRLKKRSLLLLDVGAKVANYSADITRTYAYGEPTKRQVQIHEAVREAQKRIIKLCRPGVLIEQYTQQSGEIMAETLEQVGLMKSYDEKIFHTYFPHAMGHGLGIDPHDSLGGFKEFQPGIVMTVEPGIYIPEEEIGVRLEDDIYITNNGQVNLSAKLGSEY
jgi:Xaa-Pro aminopeptidase